MADAALVPSDARQGPQPVPFARFAAPIFIPWLLICAAFVGAYPSCERTFVALPLLFPLYCALYLARMNALLAEGSMGRKVASGILLLVAGVAIAYMLRPVLVAVVFYLSLSPVYLVVLGLRPLGSSSAGFIFFVSLLLIAVLIPVTSGFVGGLVLSLFERKALGSTVARPHVIGFMKAGIPALVLLIYAREEVPKTAPAIALMAFIPVLHLTTVWYSRFSRTLPPPSRLTPRRALALALCAYSVTYAVGAVRFVPEYGAMGLLWPQVVLEDLDRPIIADTHRDVLRVPEGRGALPISGQAYLIPAGLTVWLSERWSQAPGEYRMIRVRMPYDIWIEDFRPETVWRHAAGEIQLVPARESDWGNITVLCEHERHFGLRRCFAENYDADWLNELGVDPDGLEPVRLHGQYRRPEERDVVAVEDSRGAVIEQESDGPGADRLFVARCPAWSPEEPYSQTADGHADRRRVRCTLDLLDDAVAAQVFMERELLPQWRQAQTAALQNIEAWRAAAAGGARIDAVAEAAAEERGRQLADAWAEVPVWLRFDRAMTAVLGTEWALPRQMRSYPSRFRPPRCSGPDDLS